MRRYLTVLAAAAICLAAAGTRADEILNIGDPAPKLAVSGWVKGEKVDQLEPGKTYVVEFWATWCGPCRQSIPHLTELAHKYKDKGIRFIGVDVWETDLSKVRPFVEEMGAKMDYSVALDTVPEGAKPSEGAMARTWMMAAEEHGIPAAFIIRDGKIAWIGHPMEMDKSLEEIAAGKWDPKSLAATRLIEKTKERKITAARKRVIEPYRAGDFRAALSAIDEAASSDLELAKEFVGLKLNCLIKTGEVDEAVKVGNKLIAEENDDARALARTFSSLIDPTLKTKPDPRIAKLVLAAARRAEELTKGKAYDILNVLALALYSTGDSDGAVAAQEKAIKALKDMYPDNVKSQQSFKNFVKTLESRAETFRKGSAAKAAAGGNP